MASGPPGRRRIFPRSPAPGSVRRKGRGPTSAPNEGAAPPRPWRRWVVGALVAVVAGGAIGLQLDRCDRPRDRVPAEVQGIAQGLQAKGIAVDRVARNANGGWSVLLDDGEVQWFKSPNRAESRLHPVRLGFTIRPDPNIVVLELHPTVFAIVMSGRRQGNTLELGTARTSADVIAAKVTSVVSGRRR